MVYKNKTIESNFFLKKFSHLRRFDIAIDLLGFNENDFFLDYGTQDGYLISKIINNLNQPKILFGYEPVSLEFKKLGQKLNTNDKNNVFFSSELNLIIKKYPKFNKISCLEVLEHMTSFNQDKILKDLSALLENNGKIIISVPIEIGIAGFLKNIIRYFIGQKHEDSTLANIFKSLFGMKILRQENNFINSHIGFNYKDLEKLIYKNNFIIYKKVYSPFTFIGPFINSQVFYVLIK
tara:strand:- start:108 stop:815 length:708 start_codon:yes stop_codon:yes gene_type:complete